MIGGCSRLQPLEHLRQLLFEHLAFDNLPLHGA